MSLLSHFFEGSRYHLYPPLVVLITAICLFCVLVYPGITPGIDLTGGVVLIVRTPVLVSQDAVTNVLSDEFGLEDVSVQAVSSPLGNSVRAQYSLPAFIRNAQALVVQADGLQSSDPAQSLILLKQAQSLVAQEKPFELPANASISDSIAEAKAGVAEAKESFSNRLQERLSAVLQLPADAAFSRSEVAPVLGQTFWQGALWVALASAIFLIIAVFILFREFVPSLAIILAMIFDVLMALAGMSIFGIPLSLATIPTLLMIVGYSIDTDILLTTRVLGRKEGTPTSRAIGAMTTGLAMTATGLISILVLLVLSYFAQIEVMFTIAFVLLFGLAGDIISTWFMNAPLLLWYAKSKEKTGGSH